MKQAVFAALLGVTVSAKCSCWGSIFSNGAKPTPSSSSSSSSEAPEPSSSVSVMSSESPAPSSSEEAGITSEENYSSWYTASNFLVGRWNEISNLGDPDSDNSDFIAATDKDARWSCASDDAENETWCSSWGAVL